jgi:hypothetical protein
MKQPDLYAVCVHMMIVSDSSVESDLIMQVNVMYGDMSWRLGTHKMYRHDPLEVFNNS